jgi:tetratricopeptide (TPR) repeat protein
MRDHTMLGPVPENTVDYKIPNACNECHTDRSANWAADIVSGWYPDRNPRPRLRALAFSMAKRRDAKAVAPLIKLATDKNENPMIRASAAGYLAFFPGPLPAAVLPRLVSDPEPFVRIETARALGIVGQDGAVEALARLLTDPYRSVRVQAASALVKLGFSRGENGLKPGHTALPAFANALSEYRRSLQIENDIPEVLVELGFLELFAGRLQSAAKAYRQALQFDAKQADAHIGLALVDLAQGDRKGAVDQAKRAVAISGKPEHRKVLERLTVSAP